MNSRHQPEMPTAIDIRTTRPRLRSGLRFIPKSSPDAKPWFRLEDILLRRFHRIGMAEYEFLLALDGSRTIEEAREFAAMASNQVHTLAPEQAESLLHWTVSESLIVGQDASQQARTANSRSSLAWIKLPLFSGDAHWNLPTTMFGWLFDRRSVVAMIASWMLALCIVVLDFDRFSVDVSTIFEPSGWLRLACVWLALKVVHEFGHIVCCRRFGGRVGEAGVAWMLVAPVAYVDLSDLYRMKLRNHRVLTCLAGVYSELAVAGIACFLWSQSFSPWCNHLFATVAVTASVGSVLFNLNPLMKLDGYHVLCDWIDRPNLASDGAKAVNEFTSHLFLGKRSRRNTTSSGLIAYGIAAFAYRMFIAVGLVVGSYTMYGPVGFVIVALLSVLVSVPAMIRIASRLLIEFRARPSSAIRMLLLLTCLLGIAGGGWSLRDRLQSGWCGIVEYSEDSPVRCVSSGKVVRVLIESEQQVEEGDVLVELENLSIVTQRLKAESELAAGQARWKRLCELHSTAAAAAEYDSNRAIEVRLRSFMQEENDLLVRAPRSGIVIAMEPSRWLGQWLDAGQPLAFVVDESKKKAIVAVPQDELENVVLMNGKRVSFCNTDGETIEGVVTSITCQAALTPPHPAMAGTAGGQLAVRPDDGGNDVILLSPHLRLEALIDDARNRLRPGQSLTLLR